jgi:glycerol-3-phosphate dehydrogenase
LLLGARASVEIAPVVAAILAEATGRDEAWQQTQVAEYTALAEQYML